MPNLKQGTLLFTSAKRTDSLSNGKSRQRTKAGGNKRVETLGEAKTIEVSKTSSDEESAAAAEITVPAKRTFASTKTQSSSGGTRKQSPQSEKPKPVAEIVREHLDTEDKAGRYRKHYNEVRSKMRCLPPVHAEGQNKIHIILRFFDMSYEFGPCIGMTRLERWKRAELLGLDPPMEVRDILLTKEGMEKAEYTQCVLDSEV